MSAAEGAPQPEQGQQEPQGRLPGPSAAQLISVVDAAFAAADARRSRLGPGVLDAEGMSGAKTRHLYNNLCSFAGCRCLQVCALAAALTACWLELALVTHCARSRAQRSAHAACPTLTACRLRALPIGPKRSQPLSDKVDSRRLLCALAPAGRRVEGQQRVCGAVGQPRLRGHCN